MLCKILNNKYKKATNFCFIRTTIYDKILVN